MIRRRAAEAGFKIKANSQAGGDASRAEYMTAEPSPKMI
jgi:hypothetical protein